MSFRTNAVKVQAFAGAMFGVQVGSTTMAQINADITSSGGLANALNSYYTSSFGNATTASVAATVAANLGLTGDALASGTAFITAQLNGAAAGARGAVISTILDQFAGLASDATFGAAATAYNTKVTAAVAYTGADNVAIGTVVAPAASVFALTTSSDNITGTAGNDTIRATATFSDAATPVITGTLAAADAIAGNAGTDTLEITVDGGGAANYTTGAIPVANLSGVETIAVRAVQVQAADIVTFDAATAAGITSFVNDRSTSAVTVTGLAAGASVGVTGDATVSHSTTTFGYAATNGAATINIAGGVKAGNITSSTTPTTVTINSTGAANVVGTVDVNTGATTAGLTINAATNLTATLAADYTATAALTVTGAATAVTLSAGATANFRTIDASAMTAGGVAIAGGSALTSFKGGAGNDTFTTAAAYGATTAGLVNAGTGSADVLVLNATTDLDTAAEAALYVGFDTLRTAGAQDMSLLGGITGIQMTAAGAHSQMTAAQAASVQIRADIGATSFALADSTGTADVLNITMGTGALSSGAATEAFDFTGALTMNGFESLVLTSNHGETAAVAATAAEKVAQVASFSANRLSSITLNGTSVDLQDAATTRAVTIDASALTGNGTVGLTIAGNLVAGSTVTGSGIADSVTLGTAGSTYNTGAGNDAISGTLTQLRNGTTYNTIDGGAGTDTVTISGGAALTAVDDDFKGLTNIERITVSTTTTNNQSITTGGWFDQNFKAAGARITTTSTDGNITISAGSFSGNLEIIATTADTAGADAGIVTVTTGSGNDTVTVSNTGSAASTISTGAGNDTIVGGAVVDNITGGTGSDTITGGTGADVIAFGTTGSVYGTAMDVITDFAASSDVLSFPDAALVAADTTSALVAGSNVRHTAGGLVSFATADSTLALKVTAIQADAELDAAHSVAIFVDGANTYVYYAGAATGNTDDQIIQLSGVTNLTAITDGGTTITIAV